MDTWECRICGYKFEGNDPPARCPICEAPDTDFVRITSRVKPFNFKKLERPQGSLLLQKFVEASLAKQDNISKKNEVITEDNRLQSIPKQFNKPDITIDNNFTSSQSQQLNNIEQETDNIDYLHSSTRSVSDGLILFFDMFTASYALSLTEWQEHALALRRIALNYLEQIAKKRYESLESSGAFPLGILPYLEKQDDLPSYIKIYLKRILNDMKEIKKTSDQE